MSQYLYGYSSKKRTHIIMVEIIIILTLFLASSLYSRMLKKQSYSETTNTLGVKDEYYENEYQDNKEQFNAVIIPTDTPTPLRPDEIGTTEGQAARPTPTPSLKKETYSVAVFGDSLVDTMGGHLDYLEKSLKTKYPNTLFRLYNYGIGSQNISEGLARFHDNFSYQTRHYPSLPDLHPDIIILGSFSYNPFFPSDKNRHADALQKLVEESKQVTKNTYLLVEIAPIKLHFGQGPNGVNWRDDESYEQATRIIEQLENVAVVGKNTNTPLIDTFGPSQVNSEKAGRSDYINQSDGIHPSIEGHQFMADKIAETIIFDQ